MATDLGNNYYYNDIIVCVTVINLTNAFVFIGLDRLRLTNLDRLDF